MAATNSTPIQLYHSTTASAVPVNTNLVNGELAINILDGKLYYKDNGGVVQVIATKGTGTIGGSTTQVQYNNAGALAGSANFTFNGTTATINTLNLTNALGAAYGGTAQSTYAQGDLLYASAANTLAKLPIGINTYILTSNGTIPGWAIPSSVVIGTATNLAGGAAGSVPYQSGASTTTFLSIGTANQVITSTGTAPQWSSSLTLTGLSNSGLTTLDKTVTVGNTSFNGAAVFAPSTPAKVYLGTGTVTDVTSAIAATNAAGAIVALGVTPIAATNANVTYTNASTLYIAGAPSAGTNITITNPYALYVAAGDAYFGGTVTAGTVNLTTLDLTNLEVTNIKAKDGTASIVLTDSTGAVDMSKAVTMSATTQNIALGTSQTSGTFTVGGAAQTGAITVDQSTKAHTLNIATGATESATTKTINVGTAGVSGSTTTMSIGSAVAGSATNLTVNAATTFTPIARNTGALSYFTVTTPADTLLTASTEVVGSNFTAATRQWATGALTLQRERVFAAPTYAFDGASTLTTAVNVDIAAPVAGTNATITTAYALRAAASEFTGNVTLSGGTANGVPYLNASKVLTTGSALTFDGSRIALGTATSNIQLTTTVNTNQAYISLADADGRTAVFRGPNSGSPNCAQIGTTTNHETAFLYGNAEVMRLTSTGLKASIAGTNADPVFSYTSDTNTGIFFPAADKLGFVAGGGSDDMVLTTTGLGIGTSSPTRKLSVGGTSSAVMDFYATSYRRYAIGSEARGFVIYDDTASAYRMEIDSSGNLGLGVTPSAWTTGWTALQIAATSSFTDFNGQSSYWNNCVVTGGGTTPSYQTTAAASFYRQTAGQHIWYNAASGTAGNTISFIQAMTLDASGNLAVGNTNNSALLHVGKVAQDSDVAVMIGNGATSAYTASTATLQFRHGGNGGATLNAGKIVSGRTGNYSSSADADSYLAFFTALDNTDTERARITSGGDLLVGATSSYNGASERLAVDGSQGTGGAGVAYIRNTLVSGADNAPCLVLYKAATTTSSSARFMQFYADNNGTPMGGIVGNGASNVQFASISDAREKTNIAPISGSLEKVIALKPVAFDWIASGDHCPAGFVAQDVEQIFPEFVVENMANEGQESRKGLTGGMTGGIVAHLVKAIQELKAEFDAYKASHP